MRQPNDAKNADSSRGPYDPGPHEKIHRTEAWVDLQMPTLHQKGEPMRILVTDYAWEDLEIEREILHRIGATLVAAETGSEEELVNLSPGVDGIFTNWKRVTQKVIANASNCKAIARYGVGLGSRTPDRVQSVLGLPVGVL
jgi:hypothetical protein